jgi:hypothetical protein
MVKTLEILPGVSGRWSVVGGQWEDGSKLQVQRSRFDPQSTLNFER